jgi:hypothetical protein
MGYCPFCNDLDRLLFELQDRAGVYLHCMICNKDWPRDEKIEREQ